MKKLLLITTLLFSNTLFGYNPADIETLIQSLSTNSPGCPNCDLTQLDFSKTLTDLDAGSDSYATAMNQYNPTFKSKYGSNPTLAKIVSGTNLNLSGTLLADTDMSRIKFGKVNFDSAHASGINLSSASFDSGSSFTSINLSGANLDDTQLPEANLSSASLYGSNLTFTNFTGANLTGVGFGGANVASTNFTSATIKDLYTEMNQDLTITNSEGKTVTITKGTPLDLRSVKNLNSSSKGTPTTFSGAKMPGVQLQKLTLTGCNFANADLSGANLSGANLTSVNLSGSTIGNANLTNTIFSDTNMSKANIEGTDFHVIANRSLESINMSGAIANSDTNFGAQKKNGVSEAKFNKLAVNLSKVNLSGATLNGVSFWGLNMQNSNFSKAQMSKAILSGVTATSSNFEGANLEGANLSQGHFNSSNFNSANLSNSNMSEYSYFEEASFVGTNLENANLEMANFEKATIDSVNITNTNVLGTVFYYAKFSNLQMSLAKNYKKAHYYGTIFSWINK